MSQKIIFSESQLKTLLLFLDKNKDANLADANLKDEKIVLGFDWYKLKNKKEDVLKMLQAYLRLSKIMPFENREVIMAFLKEGIHSALQIAAIPKEKFLSTYLELFGNKAMAQKFHDNAVAVKTSVLLQFMQAKQQGEPHVSQTNLRARI